MKILLSILVVLMATTAVAQDVDDQIELQVISGIPLVEEPAGKRPAWDGSDAAARAMEEESRPSQDWPDFRIGARAIARLMDPAEKGW